MTDEPDLRAGLRALAAAPPPAPDDREAGAVRRAGRLRVQRAVSACAVAAVVVAVGLVAPKVIPNEGGSGPVRPAQMSAALQAWPKHASSYDRFKAYVEKDVAPPPGNSVRWLYTGSVPDTGGTVALAYAVCGADACGSAGLWLTSPAPIGDNADPAERSWVRTSGSFSPDAPTAPLSWYADTPYATRGSVLVVVPPAGTESVTWTAPGANGGTLTRHGAMFSGVLGFVTGNATIVLKDRRGETFYEGPVGLPGSRDEPVARAPFVEQVTVPPGYRSVLTTGQQFNGAQLASSFDVPADRIGSGLAVAIRCAGPASIAVTYGDRTASVSCDGTLQRVVDGPADASRITFATTSHYVNYSAMLISPAPPG
jgi:hypothetical protein